MAGRQFKLDVLITAIDRITAPMQRINSRISQITARTQPLANSLTSLREAAGVPRLVKGFRGVGDAVNDVGRAVDRTALRIGVLAGAGAGLVYLFKREFIDTADTFERLELSLEAIEGGAVQAKQSMAFIKDLTVKTPFEMEEIAKSFRIMRGFGLDPKDGSLQAIIDQTAKLGLTGEDLSGVALQLGQAFSKGRLQAQDANILVERGVPVWGLLERAVARVGKGHKVTIAQLRKASEEGRLGTKEIRLLIEQMGLESQGASARMMSSWSGMISNLKDQWTFFKRSVMDSGPMELLKGKVTAILARIEAMAKSGELQRLAEQVGGRLVTMLERGWRVLNEDLIPAAQDLWRWANTIADAFGGWGNLLKVGIAAYIGGPLVAAVGNLLFAVASLNMALAGTPAGWLLLGAGALALAGLFVAGKSLKFPKAADPTHAPQRFDGTRALTLQDAAQFANTRNAATGFFGGGSFGLQAPTLAAPVTPPAPGGLRLSAGDAAAVRAAMQAQRDARIIVDVNGPPGTRARIAPGSASNVDLGTRIKTGLTMQEAW
jgi:tape measure domain-containing protein